MSFLKDKLKALRLEKWDKELLKNLYQNAATIYSFIISLILVLPFMKEEDFFSAQEIVSAIVKILISTALLTTLYRLPAILVYLTIDEIEKIEKATKKIDESVDTKLSSMETTLIENVKNTLENRLKAMDEAISKKMTSIDDCPRLTAFHTRNGSLENKMNAMDKLQPNQRWMMSKFISELMSSNFASFTVKMNTLEYSQFSIKIIKECTNSVHLTGSMRPSTWLDGLVDVTNNEKIKKRNAFFNHLLPSNEKFPIDENNHSVYISTCDFIKKRERIVCLSPEDMEYLFISEKSVDVYFEINDKEDGIHTYFLEWKNNSSKMNPFLYEYALYDDVLLFKYDKKSTELTILNGTSEDETPENKTEFKDVKSFFTQYLKPGSGKVRYSDLKQRICDQKLELLDEINKGNRLIHKYSYLYSGGERWQKYLQKESLRYGSPTTTAIAQLLDWAFLEESGQESQQYDIVEIGPGEGGRIFTVCDSLGTSKIKNYTLVDISKRLLDTSESILLRRLTDMTKCHTVEMDCCSEKEETKDRFKKLIKGKTVLILSNTTLFTEPKFEWESLKGAKQTFITVDLYDDAHKPFADLMKAWPLFLLPLKIFEVPIIKEVIEKLMPYIFTDEYDDINYQYNIYLNLRAYIELIARKSISGKDITADEIASELNVDNEESKIVANLISQLWNKELKGVNYEINFEANDYGEKKKQLYENNRLMVLSCLKFKKENDVEANIRTFIENKGFKQTEGYKVDVSVENDKFVGIFINKVQQTTRKNGRRRR